MASTKQMLILQLTAIQRSCNHTNNPNLPMSIIYHHSKQQQQQHRWTNSSNPKTITIWYFIKQRPFRNGANTSSSTTVYDHISHWCKRNNSQQNGIIQWTAPSISNTQSSTQIKYGNTEWNTHSNDDPAKRLTKKYSRQLPPNFKK